MTTKMLDPKIVADLSRYTPEELDPHVAEDEAEMAAFIARNREALNKALAEGYVSLANGDGTAISSLDELLTALEAERGPSS